MDQAEFNKAVLDLLDPLIDPNKEEAYRLIDLAAVKTESGDLIEAVDAYEKALELYEDHIDSWLHMGAILADLEAYDEAETSYFRALNINQYSLTAYIGLADVYERRQEYEQTVGVLQQALGVAEMLKVSAKSVSRINYFIGEFELRLKRLPGAEKAFDRAISDDPVDAELRMDIGDAYAGKGYYQESEKHYQAALRIDPNLAHVYNRLGIAYRKQQKTQKALALYESAKQHHPDDEHLMFNIARAHLEDVNAGKAEKVLAEALSIAPSFKEARQLLVRLSAPKETAQAPDSDSVELAGQESDDETAKGSGNIWDSCLDDIINSEN